MAGVAYPFMEKLCSGTRKQRLLEVAQWACDEYDIDVPLDRIARRNRQALICWWCIHYPATHIPELVQKIQGVRRQGPRVATMKQLNRFPPLNPAVDGYSSLFPPDLPFDFDTSN
jgi:hypothetical protein